MDILGFVVLVVSLVVAVGLQAGAAFGMMFAMHKGMADSLEEKTYGQFDFDGIQKPALTELFTRLLLIMGAPTLVLHLLFYFCFSPWGFRKYTAILTILLWLLETAGIGAAFYFVMRLDKVRLAVLTAGSSLFYLLLYWALIYYKMS